MFLKSLSLQLFVIKTFIVVFALTVASTIDVDFDTGDFALINKTTAISLTGSKKPFVYIELLCDGKNSSDCRRFRCSAFSKFPTRIKWIFKSCNHGNCSSTHVTEGNDMKSEGLRASSNITLKNEDYGYLSCSATNIHSNANITQEIVPVNHTDQIFINLEAQKSEYEIFREEVIITWKVVLVGRPFPDLWLIANNETMNYCDDSVKYICVVDNQRVSVTIKNASTEDLAKIFLFAKNKYEEKRFQLAFEPTNLQKTQIRVRELQEQSSVVECISFSLLPCNISWYFISCSENCTRKLLKENQSEETLQCSSTLTVDPSMTGVLECHLKTEKESTEAYQEVDSVEGGLRVSGNFTIVSEKKGSIRIKADWPNTVFLTCKASAFEYTNEIGWAWAGNDINNTNLVTETINTIFSYQKTLGLTSLGNFNIDQPFYCKARLIENNTLEVIKVEFDFGEVNKWTYYAIGVLAFLVLTISIFVVIKMQNFRKLQKEMEQLNIVGLANFEKGALEHLNPNLTIDDQADLLPYDKRYEFPIEQLKLGEQIGSGAFGIVMKGEAKGVFQNEENTTVAVKMVNRTIGDAPIKALATELKIMIHLGKHVNIVNLLGACTKNITKKELLVIVEYCSFGNLKDYLLRHRQFFIDQIDTNTGQIDFTIGSAILGTNDSEFPYITPSLTAFAGETPPENDMGKPVCTRDLLLWSFQIARGMEYLSSRKVLHGDLAARNVLLTDGNIVKICDFGLSRNLYQKEIYKKKGDEMLPVKWMSIEVLTDKVFSIQSDVWSFGVVLWEIFSLARTPYPGIEYNEAFCEKLVNGYRMKMPEFANQEIYEIMLHCWEAEPLKRPSFSELVKKINSVLDPQIAEHYVDMNSDYLKMNAQRFSDENSDYLSMLGAPEYKNHSLPSYYVNVVKSLNEEESSYL